MASSSDTLSRTLDFALTFLSEKVLDISNKQALCICDFSHLDRFTLGSINRNVKPEWVKEMKKSIQEMHAIGRRTTVTVAIDLRDIKIALEDSEAAQDFKAVIIDSQHRWMAMKELRQQHPGMDYKFWLVVYIIESEEDMKTLLFDLDRRLDITPDDKMQIEIRKRFVEAFSKITEGHEKRRCVQRTKNHPILRDADVMRALARLSVDEMISKMKDCAKLYKREYEDAGLPRSSVIHSTVEATKLYQMIQWQSGAWIKKMLGI